MPKKKLRTILHSIKDKPKVHKQVQVISKPKKNPAYRFKLTIDPEEKILFIGEGNFSFSLSIAENQGRADNLTATAYDSLPTTIEKYPDAGGNIDILKDLEAQVLFEIDATKLSSCILKKCKFDKIIFNFPHVGLGIKDQNENIMANQRLLAMFFNESSKLLNQGKSQIIVTLKTGMPYDAWNIKQLAKENNLLLERSAQFNPSDFPGYCHRRTLGFDERLSVNDNSEIQKKPSRMYIFIKKELD